MIKTIGIAAGASAWGLAVFGIALHVHFPEEPLIEQLRWQIQESSGGEWLLSAEGASPYRLTGIALEDVILFKAEKKRRRSSDDNPPAVTPVLRSDSVAVRAKPLSLLSGSQAASFSADLYSGELSGDVSLSESTTVLDARAEEIDLNLIPLGSEDWSLDAAGMLSLDVDMAFNSQNVKESEGTIDLNIDSFAINSGEFMGFTIDEPTTFSEAVLKMETKKGKLEITEGSFVSDTIEIGLDGYITLAKSFRRSRMRIGLHIKLADQYDMFAKNLPQMKSARDDEGVYHFTLSGNPSNPRLQEERQRKTVTRSDTRKAAEDRVRDREANMSDDEREADRRERMDRMQERMRGGATERSSRDEDVRAAPERPGIRPPGIGRGAERFRPDEEPMEAIPFEEEIIEDDDNLDEDDIIDEEIIDEDDEYIDDDEFIDE
jgi:type II secretion system protein N